MKRKGLKIFLATTMCIFNLFVCFTGVMAWFVSANRNIANNMQVIAATHDLDMSYKVYKYNEETRKVEDYTDKDKKFDLITYDSVLNRNEHTPIIVEMSITGMSLEDMNPVTLNVLCTETSPTAHALSNIVRFQFSHQITTISDSDTVEEKYDKALVFFRSNNTNEKTFKTLEPISKTQSISYPINTYDSSTIKVFMLLDYSSNLISQGGFAINSDHLTGNTVIAFNKDITKIECNA